MCSYVNPVIHATSVTVELLFFDCSPNYKTGPVNLTNQPIGVFIQSIRANNLPSPYAFMFSSSFTFQMLNLTKYSNIVQTHMLNDMLKPTCSIHVYLTFGPGMHSA